MVVTCPNCDTQFNLADALYIPGRKVRCSVCSHIFVLPAVIPDMEENTANNAGSLPDELGGTDFGANSPKPSSKDKNKKAKSGDKPKKGSKLKKIVLFFAVLLCLAGLGTGGYIIYFENFAVKRPPADPVAERLHNIDKVRDLPLIDVRHKYVQNVKLGPLVVITGKVRNNFTAPKEKMRVEAALLDKDGKVLAVQQQYCGIVVPEIQLQVLGQKELAQALDNRFEMLANNINVMPGIEVPFMVVFVYPPSNMVEYTVMVSDVSDPPDLAVPAQ